MHRRTFLSRLGLGGAGLLLAPQLPYYRALAAGQTLPHRNFVFVYFSGGWDTLLSLDARDPSVFDDRTDTLEEYGIELGWDAIEEEIGVPFDPSQLIQPAGSNIAFGPTMAGFAEHYDVSCVVRGLSMDTVTHEVGRRYFLTGMMPNGSVAKGSSVSTQAASQQGDLTAIPNLVARTEAYNQGDPNYASPMTVSSVADLVATLEDGPYAPDDAVRRHLELYRSQRSLCDTDRLNRWGFYNMITEAQGKARELVDGGLAGRFLLTNRGDQDARNVRDRYGVTSDLTSGAAQAAMAFQALRYNISQCVTIEIARGLDAHDNSWEDDHPERLYSGWNALGQLITDLKSQDDPIEAGKKLIETTSVLVFSEFGRTALINNRGGRDHSLTSACMLIGAGQPHNKVIGASSDQGMTPLPVDPDTGAAVSVGGATLNPSVVVASLLQGAGMETEQLRVGGLPCLMPGSESI